MGRLTVQYWAALIIGPVCRIRHLAARSRRSCLPAFAQYAWNP
jgi:hypothetical protein